MHIDYDKDNKMLKINAKGTLVLTKNKYGLSYGSGLTDSKDISVEIHNYYTILCFLMGFKKKISQSVIALKFIWKNI